MRRVERERFFSMIIEPRVRGFICMNAHPEGCAANVGEQIAHVRGRGSIDGPRSVLVVGASTGYGLASRIVAAFGCGARTVGAFFERPGSAKRSASAGWYNTVAFERAAAEAGLGAWSYNGDAFADEAKERVLDLIRTHLDGSVDLVVYSLASPRRVHPESGEVFNSFIKPIGAPFAGKTIDARSGALADARIEPANEQEVEHTVAVMGGDDWRRWIDALDGAGVLAPECRTLAYTYLGPEHTWPIYRDGTIGKAKEDLQRDRRRAGRAAARARRPGAAVGQPRAGDAGQRRDPDGRGLPGHAGAVAARTGHGRGVHRADGPPVPGAAVRCGRHPRGRCRPHPAGRLRDGRCGAGGGSRAVGAGDRAGGTGRSWTSRATSVSFCGCSASGCRPSTTARTSIPRWRSPRSTASGR